MADARGTVEDARALGIVAVVVTYNPAPTTFIKLLGGLASQVKAVVVVDNASATDVSSLVGQASKHNVTLRRFEKNVGIAAAQNLGIETADVLGCDAVIFFDQDSEVPAGLVSQLNRHLRDAAVSIAAPVHFDADQGFGYPIVDIAAHGGRRKYRPERLTAPVDVSVAISSGTLARRAVFEQVGLMEERLFIDYVDTEWCLRCAQRGIRVRVDPAARLHHSLGLRSVSVGPFRVPIHSAERRYYRVRNAFLLARYPHVPKLMVAQEMLFGLIHSVLILFFVRRRAQYLRYYVKGVVDGILGRAGACPTKDSTRTCV